MNDVEPEFRIHAVRSPNLADEEIQPCWNQIFDILLKAGREKRKQEAAPEEAKPKPPDTIPVTDDLFFEVSDNHLLLRRGKAAIATSPSDVGTLLDGSLAAAAKLVSHQQPSKLRCHESDDACKQQLADNTGRLDPIFSPHSCCPRLFCS